MSKAIERIKLNAEKLGAIRKAIKMVEEETAIKLHALKETRDQLQAELIAGFENEGLSSIKTDEGESYSRSVRQNIEITNEIAALGWAMEKRAVSINKPVIAQMLKDAKELPVGFERRETAFISVRSPKKKDDAERVEKEMDKGFEDKSGASNSGDR